MRITDVQSFRLPLPGAKPAFGWRRGLLVSGPDAEGFVHAPSGPDIALPAGLDYPAALEPYVEVLTER